jgi:F-type H+-transporting ATPase subunit delta
MAVQMQGASRESLADAQTRMDSQVDSSSVDELRALGDQLFSVLRLLAGEPTLRRHLADSSVPEESRSGLVDRLLGSKLDRPALDVLSELVSARWSRAADLLDAVELLARRAVFGVAEKDDSLENVEDELFRFGRILDREAKLSRLLSDHTMPADPRVQLLDRVLGGSEGQRVSPVTRTLLEQIVRTPRGRRLDTEAEELAELAAARRDRYVAHVSTPVALSSEQEQRLSESLGRLYGRKLSLQMELDPSLLGGVVVRIGGEIIDGSLSSRLQAAKRTLPK